MAKFFLYLFALTFFFALTQSRHVFNVMKYGAKGDGHLDDTQAVMNAWNSLCGYSAYLSTLHVPRGKTLLLQPLTFNGPCKPKHINFQIDGKIIAPSDPFEWSFNGENCRQWIRFKNLDGLHIYGSGSISGRATKWWSLKSKEIKRKLGCDHKPTGFIIENSNNVHISGLTFEDSPQMHIAFEKSTGVYANDLTIRASASSPNTDGIHIQHSTKVSIDNSNIGTGDDCISIGDGSSHINITRVTCGPGHGISIGSLGKYGSTETVEYVNVKNCIFRGTTNGVRIKTWQGGKGYARHITFANIRSYGSTRPIIIDQYYCDHTTCKNQTSAVGISNIVYDNITGTSMTDIAVKLACSKSVPCAGIVMKNIGLRPAKGRKSVSSYCMNVEGYKNDGVFPDIPCLVENNRI